MSIFSDYFFINFSFSWEWNELDAVHVPKDVADQCLSKEETDVDYKFVTDVVNCQRITMKSVTLQSKFDDINYRAQYA